MTRWYVSGGGIARGGPYPTQADAYSAMRLTDDARDRQRRERGTASPYPWDLVVWPETDEETDGRRA